MKNVYKNTQQKGHIGTKEKNAWGMRRAGGTESHMAQKKKNQK